MLDAKSSGLFPCLLLVILGLFIITFGAEVFESCIMNLTIFTINNWWKIPEEKKIEALQQFGA